MSEQLKALDRFKFAAIEADTLHAATKEQISKALFELEEGLFFGAILGGGIEPDSCSKGKRDREKLKAIFNEIQERYLSLQSESKALRQELDQTKGRLEEGEHFIHFLFYFLAVSEHIEQSQSPSVMSRLVEES